MKIAKSIQSTTEARQRRRLLRDNAPPSFLVFLAFVVVSTILPGSSYASADNHNATNIFNVLDGLELAESDQQCLDDTMELVTSSPGWGTGVFVQAMTSIEKKNIDNTHMTIEFPKSLVDGMQVFCDRNGGLFIYIEEKEFVCDIDSVAMNVKLTGFASCNADTQECRVANPTFMVKDAWDFMGMKCEEKTP